MLRGSYIGFGLAAAFLYAAQHPLSKPAASRLGDSWSASASLLLIVQVAMVLIGLVIAAWSPRIRSAIVAILRDTANWGKLFLLSTIGLASIGLYIVNMHALSPILMAVVLNMFPFWNLIVTSIVQKRWPGLLPVVVIATVAASLLIVTALFDPTFQLSNFVFRFAAISLVPIFYSVHYNLQAKYFAKHDTFAFVLAANLFDAPIVIFALAGFAVFAPLPVFSAGFFRVDVFLYVAGAVLSSLGARTMLQKGGKILPDGKIWTPFCLFLVPAMTVAIASVASPIFAIILGQEFQPVDYELTLLSGIQVGIVTVVLLADQLRKLYVTRSEARLNQ
jgi:hypothetical protein